jgi:hypothetical protein
VAAPPKLVEADYEITNFYGKSQNYFVKFLDPKVHEILLQGKKIFSNDTRKAVQIHLYYNKKEVPSNTALRVMTRIGNHINHSQSQQGNVMGLWFVTEDEKPGKKDIDAIRLEVKGSQDIV